VLIRTPFIDKYFFITYERSTSKRSMLFSTQENRSTSLNFKTLSLTIAIVNGSRHESQHNKFTTRRAIGFVLYEARNEMECQGLGRTNLFLASPRSSRIFGNRTQDRQTARWQNQVKIRRANRLKPLFL